MEDPATTSLVEAIKTGAWDTAEGLSDRDSALCQVAFKLSGTPTRMLEEDWAPLRALGFDEGGLLEVAHVVGIFNHLTRLADGFGLSLDPGTAQAGESGSPLLPKN